jgi:hypothetical protein
MKEIENFLDNLLKIKELWEYFQIFNSKIPIKEQLIK